MASNSEEELRRLTVEIRLLEQTAEALQSRANMINAVTTDLSYARMTLEGLEKESEKSELLVPIGGTSYVRARLENPDKIIVGMGAGVSVEKTREETKEIIKKRLEDLEKTRASIQQQFAQVAEKINLDREKADALVATMREGKPQ
ncbi:MAG: prefoldin subunit alpha [Candidatus Bathyarchaeia archaeon]